MAKKYEMAVKTGSYQVGRDTKNRYENCGEIHSGQYGFYARINPFVMMGLAMQAIATGQDSLMVSLFETRSSDGGNAHAGGDDSENIRDAHDNFDDADIPF